MNFTVFRASFLAVCVGLGAQTAAAHPLPETSLTISNGGGDLILTVAVPVPELNLAMPKDAGLGDAPPSGPVSPADLARLADYFGAHLAVSVADLGQLNMQLRGASVTDAARTETGHFDLLTLDFAAPFPMDIGIFPMTITYDAVMHQVRNHRANVFWQLQEQPVRQLGQIKFDQKLGKTAPLILDPAP